MAFIKKISDYITEHYDLTKENITIVFPNKRAALQLRNELAKTITTNFWVPQILSISRPWKNGAACNSLIILKLYSRLSR